MKSKAPQPKVVSAALAAGLGILLTFIDQQSGGHVTPQVGAALSTVLATIAGYLTPNDKAMLTAWVKRLRTPKPKPKPPPAGPFSMFDTVPGPGVQAIPANAVAVAGYIDGHYQSFADLAKRFYPHAHCVSISVWGNDAACLDVETGDATPSQVPGWVRRQQSNGAKRPIVYANRSTMPAVWSALNGAGIKRNEVRLWVADWTGTPHIPPGYDACQWIDHGPHGENYDQSLCLGNFFEDV